VNAVGIMEKLTRQRAWSHLPAFHSEGGTWTHGDVYRLAAGSATILQRAGVDPGTLVVIALPDELAFVLAFLAVARLGATAVLVNPRLAPSEHDAIIEDCKARVVVTTEEVAHRFGALRTVLADELVRKAKDEAATQIAPVDSHAPLYVQYTSGTTGSPKGVVHRHGNLGQYHRSIARRALGITAGHVTLSVSKLFFAYGFGNALVFPLYTGSSAVLIAGKPAPEVVANHITRFGVSHLYAVPTAYANLIADCDARAFETVKVAISAGEALSVPLAERAEAVLGAPVLNQLGATEAGHAICTNTPRDNTPGTIGRPISRFELEIRDGQQLIDAPDVAGDLWVRGPTVMKEYLGKPEATARVLADGWLATRDRALRRPDGTYVHLGRADDIEMVGGITVAPLEVEQVLSRHPLVKEVAVAAVRDEAGASSLRAFVVVVDSDLERGTIERDLLATARTDLAPFKVPRSVHFVRELPRTPSGKLRRFQLRQTEPRTPALS
jgi:fatty acid CoA ligase FadD22